ncbi:maleylpyruvate isomerase N-terminal domain-containing protein [Streptomyces paromomycinus]|uniref:maleylpyruvate isomerase N-terminal domain-containing protein n=1 Tax=Streptomyces paromomycinus TaxID=92743 RepID=UPI000F61C065
MLADFFADFDDLAWQAASLCPGWTVRDVTELMTELMTLSSRTTLLGTNKARSGRATNGTGWKPTWHGNGPQDSGRPSSSPSARDGRLGPPRAFVQPVGRPATTCRSRHGSVSEACREGSRASPEADGNSAGSAGGCAVGSRRYRAVGVPPVGRPVPALRPPHARHLQTDQAAGLFGRL